MKTKPYKTKDRPASDAEWIEAYTMDKVRDIEKAGRTPKGRKGDKKND